MKEGIHVQCATYNGNLGKTTRDLHSWLVPTLSKSKGESPPDILAVGFQEVLPLPLALAGFTKPALHLHGERILDTIQSFEPYTYSLLAREIIGGTALLIFVRNGGLRGEVANVQVGRAACGVGNVMGNKGAVAARLELTTGDVLTFLSAHLTPHDGNFDRRNKDFRTIVQRLVFRNHKSKTEFQIYDTNYLFFFGDLNYRLSFPSSRAPPRPTLLNNIHSDPVSLLNQSDELLPLLRASKASGARLYAGMEEQFIAFKPTYKFKTGKEEGYSTKRTPAWCDRVLFAAAEGRKVEGKGYLSVEEFVESDHKPVTAHFYLPPSISEAGDFIPCPYHINPYYRYLSLVGLFIDRLVGFVWTVLTLLLHPGSMGRGVLAASLVGLAGVWWSGWMGVVSARFMGFLGY